MRVLEADWLDHTADGRGGEAQELERLPVQLVDLLDRLGREFRRRHVEEDIRAGRLQLYDVRIDGRLGDVEGFLGDDHRLSLVTEAGLDALEVVLSEIIVLIENCDLRRRLLL